MRIIITDSNNQDYSLMVADPVKFIASLTSRQGDFLSVRLRSNSEVQVAVAVSHIVSVVVE